MSKFVVKFCEMRACQHWRIDNKCIKHNQSIEKNIDYCSNLHNSKICQVRNQLNNYRLKKLVEDQA